MKHILLPSLLVASLAVPAMAEDMTPAELFGMKMATNSASSATMETAVEVLQGDTVDEYLPLGSQEIVTRSNGISPGMRQLAVNLGVNADDYTVAELAKIFIGKYD